MSEPDQEYLCSICHGVLRDPHATECCGQHFCEKCLNEWFRQEGRTICPHCRRTRFNHIRYLPLKRKIDGFGVFCSNKGQGCQVVSTVGELSSHLGNCPYSRVPCDKCRWFILRKYLNFHSLQECPKRVVNCVYCGVAGEHAVIASEQHQARCPDYPVGCPRKCETGQEVKRKDLKSHADVCPLEPVRCKDCKSNLLRVELGHHARNECEFRLVHCPHCNRQGTYKAITPHTKICDEAPVECPNKCGQDLKRKQLVDGTHSQVCLLQPLICAKCMVCLVRKELISHNQSYCPKRIMSCGYCHQGIPHDEMQLHVQEVCGEYPVGCPRKCNKSSEELKRKDQIRHAEICPLEPVQCPYYEVGCDTEVIRKELSSHMESYMTQHLAKVTEAHEKQSHKLKKQTADLSDARKQNAKLREDRGKSIASLNKMKSSLSFEVNWLKKHNPSGKFKLSYRCLKAIADPKLMPDDQNDALAFRVPPISHSWTSPPFYLFSAGHKMKISFIAKAQTIVASLYLLKRENDSELKWPIEEQFKIKLKVDGKPKQKKSSPSWSRAHHRYPYSASQPSHSDDYDTYSGASARAYYSSDDDYDDEEDNGDDDDYDYEDDSDYEDSYDDEDDYYSVQQESSTSELEVPLYHCSHCMPCMPKVHMPLSTRSTVRFLPFPRRRLPSLPTTVHEPTEGLKKDAEHEIGHITVTHDGPWVAEVSLSKHVHKTYCSRCNQQIINEITETQSRERTVCKSCEERRKWEQEEYYSDHYYSDFA